MISTSGDLLVILMTPPEGFPTKKVGKIWMCAMFSLKALIEGSGRHPTQQVRTYAQCLLSKFSGFMLPFSIRRVLRKYHIPHEKFSGKGRSHTEKVLLLKEKLQKWPVFVLIANAYVRGDKPRLINAIHYWHYITIWGYDDNKQIFYIYDFNTVKRNFLDLPIGNSRMTYKELIRYRSIGATWMVRCYGISISYKDMQKC